MARRIPGRVKSAIKLGLRKQAQRSNVSKPVGARSQAAYNKPKSR